MDILLSFSSLRGPWSEDKRKSSNHLTMARKTRGSGGTRRPPVDDDPYGLNEVDEFAAKREKVLLDQSSLKDMQRGDDDDDDVIYDDEEEEVMADGMSSEEELSGEEAEEGEEGDEVDADKVYHQVFGRKLDLDYPDVAPEDETMLANETAWGSTKDEYYGADDLDDEETAKEIEKEALRQQRKHLQELHMDDYIDDEVEEEWSKNAKQFDMAEFQHSVQQQENKVSVKDVLHVDTEAKQDYLRTLFPEFIPLCKELTELSETLKLLRSQEQTEPVKLKVMALSVYLGTISSYLGIFLHELHLNESFTTMKNHPVMEAILTSKEVWRQASEIPEDTGVHASVSEEQDSRHEQAADFEPLNAPIGELDEETLKKAEEDISEADVDEAGDISEENEENENDDEEEESEADLDDFEAYVTQSRIKKASPKEKNSVVESSNDFLESEMADIDAQEKKLRKKSLRFYTSKIDQQKNKKTDKFNGDDDIPYRERLFERKQRLLEEARKRGLQDSHGDNLDESNYSAADEATAKAINNDSINGYYEQIMASREHRKKARAEAHKAASIIAREGKLAEALEGIGEDGKRAINYQILKNKGLTPKRKKENRNARVKKRRKYEKAQKKLKSIRAVYSGGQHGVYEGEKTGIKKNLVKSIKFKN